MKTEYKKVMEDKNKDFHGPKLKQLHLQNKTSIGLKLKSLKYLSSLSLKMIEQTCAKINSFLKQHKTK